jgi:hypothetical protein
MIGLWPFRAMAEGAEFPRHILAPEPPNALFPDRDNFINALRNAATALKHHEGVGDLYDPDPLIALMAPEVEIFVASRRDPEASEFELVGRYRPRDTLAVLGRLGRGDHSETTVSQRYGMRVVETLLYDRTVGPSRWLGGRECTSAYGKISKEEFVELVATTGFDAGTWSIVIPGRERAPSGASLISHMLVSLHDLGARNGSLWTLSLPERRYVPFRGNRFEFDWLAPYLGSHACFEKTAEGMRLSAVAIRLD